MSTISDKSLFFPDPPAGVPIWLNPCITISGGTDKVIFGVANTIDITFKRRDAMTSPPEFATVATVDAFVANPSGTMQPSAPPGNSVSQPLGGQDFPLSGIAAGDSQPATFKWTPTSSDPIISGNVGRQHFCIVARCYTNDDALDSTFLVGQDQHYAQHNLDIVQAMMRREQRIAQEVIQTVNANPNAPEKVTLRVMADLSPHPNVIKILTPALEATPGFERFVTRSPAGFGLQLPDFPNAKVRDNTKGGCLGLFAKLARLLGLKGFGFVPSYESDITLQPDQVTKFSLTMDVTGSNLGDAHIFHATHIQSDGKVIGGLTIVAVAV